MAQNTHDTQDERYQLDRPYLTIPYWAPGHFNVTDPGDKGDVRPVPAGVISYLCPGIAPLSPFVPGQPLTVQVAVRNWGGGSTTGNAVVTVWWEFPATGFAQMLPSRLFGVCSVAVPPRGDTSYTSPITNVVPTAVGEHICLVARVSHPRDPVPINTAGNESPEPGGERHWAQRNVAYVAPPPGGVIDFSFWAANTDERDREYTFQARPFAGERLQHLTRTLRAAPVQVESTSEFSEAGEFLARAGRTARHPEASFRLHAGSRRAMQLRMKVGAGPAEGQCAAFEILQQRRDDDRLVGGIALIVLPSGDHR